MNATVNKTLVIVGMPGSGKSTVGRRIAARLAMPFADSDAEVEAAAGMTVSQIFERLGEAEFRKGEKRVIARLLAGSPQILATGGGAFMDEDTRKLIKKHAVSLWLCADFYVLFERTSRNDNRPLLRDNAQETLKKLLDTREAVYSAADIKVMTGSHPIEDTVEDVLNKLAEYHQKLEKN